MRTADGEIRGLSYQATPGMLVYRRSIAKAVLGTDDPETVAAAVSDWDKFYETAERMKDAGYYMYSGRADTYRVYSGLSEPWAATSQVPPQKKLWGLGQEAQSWAAAVSVTLGLMHTSRPQAGQYRPEQHLLL